MLIRRITQEDLSECGTIYSRAFAGPPYHEDWDIGMATEMLSGLLMRDPESAWCVDEDGEIAGFAFCTTYGTFRATIQEFAFAPRFQRRGFGTALMNHVLGQFRLAGIKTLDLVVRREAPAHGFYRRFGFQQPENYIIMARWL